MDSTATNIAVAGKCGFALYSGAKRKWKLFGNELQVGFVQVQGPASTYSSSSSVSASLLWLPAGTKPGVSWRVGLVPGGSGISMSNTGWLR